MNTIIKWEERGSSLCGGGKLRKEFTAAGKLGRNHEDCAAHEIEAGYNFNGSGGKAFGGAPLWPVVKATVAFEEGQEKERDDFVEALKLFVESYFAPKLGVPLKDLPKWTAQQAAKK